MANNKEIKIRVGIAGEKEFNAALHEAQRNLKTLKSELKAETAELGANATAQQKNEVRAKSLKAQIAEQEKVVETLRKALAEVKKDYGDNEDIVQEWEQKLNDARASLAYLQNGLSTTENAMRGASDATAEGVTATKSFADALNSVASVGESVSGAIEDIFTGLISTVGDVIVDLWDMIGETAAKANNWTDIAGYWNTDPATVEKYARAVEATGKSFTDLEAVVSKLVLGGKGKDIAEMLGISDVNYEDQWDYAMAVMDRIYELKNSGNLPDNMWETLFGEKKATKAMNLINGWKDIRNGLTTYNADEGGFGMGTDNLAVLNDYYVQMNELEQKWIALKDEVAAGLGTVTADMLVNVSGGLDALNDYLNADSEEERQAALEKLTQNVEEFFDKLAAAIELGLDTLNKVGTSLARSDNPITSTIGKLLVALTDTGQWLIDHSEEVKTKIEAIFGFWLLAKLSMIGAKLASIVAQIAVIRGFKNWNMAAEAAKNAASSGSGSAAGAAAGGSGWLANMGMSFQMAGGAGVALPVAALAAAGYGGAKLIEANLNDEDLNAVYGRENGTGGLIETMSDESLKRAWDYYRIYSDSSMTGTEEAFDARDRLFESLERDGFEMSEQSVSLLENMFDNYLMETDPDGLIEQLEQRYPDFFNTDAEWQDAAATINDHLDQLLVGSDRGSKNGLTSEDVGAFRGLPGLLRQALFNQVGSLKVVMDGQTVGRIVAPYVSVEIAGSVTG